MSKRGWRWLTTATVCIGLAACCELPGGSVTAVTIEPTAVTLRIAQTQTFTATGTGTTNTNVTWTATGGTYETATSTADPSRHATATIHVVTHPDQLRAHQYGTSGCDYASGVAVDADGNVYLAGRTDGQLDGPGSNQGGYDVIVAKYAPNGDRQWLTRIGSTADDYAYAIAIDGYGNAYVAGNTSGNLGGPGAHQGSDDAFIMKLNQHGIHQWTHQFGTSALDGAHGVAVGAAGNVVVTGRTHASLYGPHQGGFDVFVLKLNAAGGTEWSRQFGTGTNDAGYGVAIDLLGNVIVAGYTQGSLSGAGGSHGMEDGFVAKLTADGTPLGARQYGTPHSDRLRTAAVGLAGNIVAAGYTNGAYAEPNPGRVDDALVIKLDANGEQLLARQFGPWGWAYDVAVGLAGNVFVAGHTSGDLAGRRQGQDDAFVIELAP